MTSSTKPEIHNILHCRQRRAEPRPQLTRRENVVKFAYAFLRYARGQTYIQSDRQTNKRIDIQTRRSRCFIPSRGEAIKHHGGKIIQVFLGTRGPLDSECLPSSATGFQECIPNGVWYKGIYTPKIAKLDLITGAEYVDNLVNVNMCILVHEYDVPA